MTEGEAGRWLVMGISLVSSPVHLPFHYRFISDRDYVIVSESSHGIVFSIVFNDTNAAGKLRSFMRSFMQVYWPCTDGLFA